MDALKRSLAPIPVEAWGEIDSLARQTLVANLSARRFVDVSGPHGLTFACVALGRLTVSEGQDPAAVRYGVHQVQPLVEARVTFQLNQWELDNLVRGAKDVELAALSEAALKLAKFEENAVYNGFKPGGIPGIHAAASGNPIELLLDAHACIDALTEGQERLVQAGIDGGCAFVVSPPVWKFLARNSHGGTLRQLVQTQIGGPVVYSNTVKGALLVSLRGGDLELVLGQDISIGYSHHDAQIVQLYISESFTFRVITPEALVPFRIK